MVNGDQLFKVMVEQKASDLFLKAGSRPSMRVRGIMTPFGTERMSRAELLELAHDLMGPERQQVFQQDRELNFAFERQTIGRFRANVLWEQGRLAMVIRRVNDHIPDFETLHLPATVMKRFTEELKGLVLIAGPTGTGKSTTAAAVLEHINKTQPCHIVSLEDPLEFLFEEDLAVINQREVGVDTKSFSEGLKNVLRQSPDVLFLSDLRDQDAMEAALLAAEAGQMVLSCIHTTNAMTTIERIVTFFPSHQQQTVRFRLAQVLKGIVCLRLLPRRDGLGQVPAFEVFVLTPRIRELLREGKTELIPPLIYDGAIHGMQTMAQSLYQLIRSGQVSVEEAMKVVDSPEELELALREIRAIKDAPDPNTLPPESA